jgi:hypothetical protein
MGVSQPETLPGYWRTLIKSERGNAAGNMYLERFQKKQICKGVNGRQKKIFFFSCWCHDFYFWPPIVLYWYMTIIAPKSHITVEPIVCIRLLLIRTTIALPFLSILRIFGFVELYGIHDYVLGVPSSMHPMNASSRSIRFVFIRDRLYRRSVLESVFLCSAPSSSRPSVVFIGSYM